MRIYINAEVWHEYPDDYSTYIEATGHFLVLKISDASGEHIDTYKEWTSIIRSTIEEEKKL